MIKELVNYAEWLKDDFPELFEGTITEGLHIGIKVVRQEKEQYTFEYKSKVYRKGEELDEFLIELRKREIISKALGNNKGIIDKVIFSNNPYALFFKLYFTKSENNVLDKDAWERFVNEKKEQNDIEGIKNDLEDEFITPKLKRMFNLNEEDKKNAIGYYKKIQEEYMYDTDSKEITLVKQIEEYVEKEIKDKILNDPNFISMFIKEENEKIKFEKKFFDKEIRVNFLVNEELLEKASDRYFSKKIFVKDVFNKEVSKEIFGLPNFFNKVADKKVFNFHKTSFFKVNKLVPINWALILNELLNIKENLPNPLPIFIDKNELNAKVIILFKKDKRNRYKEIISELAKNHRGDLGNYYLLNFSKKKINDLDYVSSFKFYLPKEYSIPKETLKVFSIKNKNFKMNNIFDIENILDNNFFFERLKDNYFSDEVKDHKVPSVVLNNIYKYRKTIYDAIYKSRLHLITSQMIKEICEPVIHYEISHDETDEKTGESKYEWRIIQKILYYFVLNKIFDKGNKNTGGIYMPSKLPEYFYNLEKLLKGEINSFESEEDFAFGVGQLIRCLLKQSGSGNKNHSMLNPFLQKINNHGLFMKQLLTTFKTYSHKIKMYYEMFDKLMANVTGYELQDKTLKDLEMIIISGYFADSVIEKLLDERGKKNKDNKFGNNDAQMGN